VIGRPGVTRAAVDSCDLRLRPCQSCLLWRFTSQCARQARARTVKDKVTRTSTSGSRELTGSWFNDETSDCHDSSIYLDCHAVNSCCESITGGLAVNPAIAWPSCESTSSAMVITPISNRLKSILARLF
jgi:hypothetical protein